MSSNSNNSNDHHPLLTTNNNKRTLITIPSATFHNKKSNLILLQVPKDKVSSITNDNCYMIGTNTNNEEDKKNVNLILPTIGKTYTLNRVETSNTLIALPPPLLSNTNNHTNDNALLEIQGHVLGRPTCSFLELKSYSIQKYNVYEYLDAKQPLTLSMIANHFQCSEFEIHTILNTIPLAYHDTNDTTWSIMTEEIQCEINSYIIECIIEYDWQDDKTINIDDAIHTVKEKVISHEENMNSSIIRHCILSMVCDTNATMIKFDTNKILIQVSKVILYKHRIMPLPSFLKQLELELPHGITIPTNRQELNQNLHAVVGIISLTTTNESIIEYYPHDIVLSLNPKQRFKQLFSKKSKWSYEELKPFLMQLCEDDGTLDVLLAEYTKVEKDGDASLYVVK